MEIRLQSLEIVEPAWYQAWPTRVFSMPTKRKMQSYVHMYYIQVCTWIWSNLYIAYSVYTFILSYLSVMHTHMIACLPVCAGWLSKGLWSIQCWRCPSLLKIISTQMCLFQKDTVPKPPVFDWSFSTFIRIKW